MSSRDDAYIAHVWWTVSKWGTTFWALQEPLVLWRETLQRFKKDVRGLAANGEP